MSLIKSGGKASDSPGESHYSTRGDLITGIPVFQSPWGIGQDYLGRDQGNPFGSHKHSGSQDEDHKREESSLGKSGKRIGLDEGIKSLKIQGRG